MHTVEAAPAAPSSLRTFANPALVVAHPGHELRVFGWMEAMHPRVCVLTDGSGSRGEGRLDSTTRLLARTAATGGPVYGRMSDREIYAAILARDFARFTRLADELAAWLVDEEIDQVVGDGAEGYNPAHDVCRMVTNTAVRLAGGARGVSIAAYEFPLVGPPNHCPDHLRDEAIWVALDDAALARKLDAARAYAELAGEVESALDRFGVAPFRTECLVPVDLSTPYSLDPAETPFYERYGEERVAAGVYDRVLRLQQHMLPLAEALWSHGEQRS